MDETIEISLDGIDTLILAAPVHEHRHPERFEKFVATHRDALDCGWTPMLSVSLSATFPKAWKRIRQQRND
ncbi:flavodoxin domain-containing protein [Roseovarius tibetensis]|uniref:flavodoxin domain-containing protein n=1 Tax=Roseovarius tibetensis TaxID=2685897 RepID=UPI003D7F3534